MRKRHAAQRRAPLLLVRVEQEFLDALDRLAARFHLGERGRAEMARDLMRRGLAVLLDEARRKDLSRTVEEALMSIPRKPKGGSR